ncbi:MAG: NAD-dependent dehydratase, partial [Anaerolineae bacterium]
LGVGQDIAIGDLARLIIQHIGRPVTIETEAARRRPEGSEVMRLHSDNGRARQALSWEPAYSLKAGLAETITWVEKNLNRFQVGRYEI